MMERALRKSAISVIVFQRNVFLCVSVFLLISVVALAVIAFKQETITIFKAPEQKIDLQAAEKEALYVTHLILNRSPSNWERQNEALFQWVSPDYAIPFRAKLKREKLKTLQHQKTYEWEALSSRLEVVDAHTIRTFVEGKLHVYIPKNEGTKQLIEKQNVKYLLIFSSSEGKLLLKSFTKENL
ncbi:MAG: hypothetical protein K1060chlam2_00574 [Chlamydiae bacterium]|nr:hypothetical protein [Chlamydiota bacterium]